MFLISNNCVAGSVRVWPRASAGLLRAAVSRQSPLCQVPTHPRRQQARGLHRPAAGALWQGDGGSLHLGYEVVVVNSSNDDATMRHSNNY